MTAGFVLDASVVIAAVLGEQETLGEAVAVMQTLKETTALVPAIWQAEVANVLAVKERQKRIDQALLKKIVTQLGELPIEVDLGAARDTFDRVLPLARRHQLSVYDACYLELAIRERLPIATFDKALRDAAKREGLELLGSMTSTTAPHGSPPTDKSDEVGMATSIAEKVDGLREIPCPYCAAKGQPGIDPGEPILGGHTKAALCGSCDLHGVVWRLRNVAKAFTAREVIARWGVDGSPNNS